MRMMRRELPIPRRLVNLALLDVVEGADGSSVQQTDSGQYRFHMTVYGNPCEFTACAKQSPTHSSVLEVELTESPHRLSPDGQARVLRFLLDSVEQLMENELSSPDPTEKGVCVT